MPELKVSPDGKAVAIRSVYAQDAFNAWGVMHSQNGGHWASAGEIADWPDVEVPEPAPADSPS